MSMCVFCFDVGDGESGDVVNSLLDRYSLEAMVM
jgi:hypothetical protein